MLRWQFLHAPPPSRGQGSCPLAVAVWGRVLQAWGEGRYLLPTWLAEFSQPGLQPAVPFRALLVQAVPRVA